MMNHRKIIFITLVAGTLLSGCGKTEIVQVNVSENSRLSSNTFGIENLIKIGKSLYYDSSTHIVYFWNGYFWSYSSITPSPYYAPNGKPYRYNPETNTFEQIE